jgi:hypothetical protein
MAETAALLPTILSAAGTAYAASAMSRSPPKPSSPTRMPDPQSPDVVEARRRRLAETQSASGRDSTILSDDSYSNSLLGQ